MQHLIQKAETQDAQDELAQFRQQFHIPQHNGKPCLYFTGNSLGLQPKTAENYVREEFEAWRQWGVEGHFKAKRPWYAYHEFFSNALPGVVGARESEVVAMGSLTGNLHLLLASFYQPKNGRTKILCESKAFPSDRYALRAQIEWHGLNPDEHLIEVPTKNDLVHNDRVIEAIFEHGESLATVLIGGVNYFSGQVFNMAAITDAAHKVGAYCGFDLAHAAGNVELKLHEWQVDFAAWCTYKYLNSGPGAVGGLFVHDNHHRRKLPKLAGWWGHDKATRFLMQPDFVAMHSAESWQQSNAPVMNMAAHLASLEIFNAAGMGALVKKGKALSAFLAEVVSAVSERHGAEFRIITPLDEAQRGCQISFVAPHHGKELFSTLSAAGVVADWREPNVIRMAPVPLYNSYSDVAAFGTILSSILEKQPVKR